MDTRKLVLRETAVMALGQAICVAAMLGIFALLGKLDPPALRGGILGGLLATVNHFFLAMGVTMAAEKASGGESAKAGKGLVQASFLIRTLLLFVVMFALLKSGLCSVFALVLPLLFVRPILIVEQFFQKDGEAKS